MTESGIFEILADPTRRRILDTMRLRERSVGEIVDEVGIGQPGISRQLAILHEAGFVEVRPDGRKRFYALRPDPFEELEEWARDVRQTLAKRYQRLDAHLERRKAERSVKR
ncbi:MAG: ArsR/SmtB family transcription factor [Thermoplasmatota archaeon]